MKLLKALFLPIIICTIAITTLAQTTTFTYQGRLTDGATAANGAYDMQFKLFDTNGTQLGSTITKSTVTVTNGVFTVMLDYGAAAFSGNDRLLEISIRPGGSADPYTTLNPRQPITSTPYAIRSATATTADTSFNATKLGSVNADQYVLTTDPRLAGGNNNYIQNGGTQQSANFNISGDGSVAGNLTGGAVNSLIWYSLQNKRILAAPNDNTFVGLEAGTLNQSAGIQNTFIGNFAGRNNTTGLGNTFVGMSAGRDSSTATGNSFFGSLAGFSNTTGVLNSFFGRETGKNNKTGFQNAFFGYSAGIENVAGSGNAFFGAHAGSQNLASDNSFFGHRSGISNTSGSSNAFFGKETGGATLTGNNNSFFGTQSGSSNESGSFNTLLGVSSDVGADNLINGTAIGAKAYVTQNHSLVLGSINGVNGASNDTRVGIGTTAPTDRLTIKTGGNSWGVVHTDGTISFGSFVGGAGNGGQFGTRSNHPLHFFVNNGPASVTLDTTGVLRLVNLGAGGVTSLCRNPTNQISTCSSSLRYKTNVQPFIGGLAVVNRLRPITFDWKQGGLHDLGFAAEDVAAVEPLLATRNELGQVEGVKYDRITAVLVNAVKEQQEQIKQQQQEIAALKQLICRKRKHSVCK